MLDDRLVQLVRGSAKNGFLMTRSAFSVLVKMICSPPAATTENNYLYEPNVTQSILQISGVIFPHTKVLLWHCGGSFGTTPW